MSQGQQPKPQDSIQGRHNECVSECGFQRRFGLLLCALSHRINKIMLSKKNKKKREGGRKVPQNDWERSIKWIHLE